MAVFCAALGTSHLLLALLQFVGWPAPSDPLLGLVIAVASGIYLMGTKDVYGKTPQGYAHVLVGGLFTLFFSGFEWLRIGGQYLSQWMEGEVAPVNWNTPVLGMAALGVLTLWVGRRWIRKVS